MKPHRHASLFLIVPTLLLFSGCLEEHVRTTISPDGSIERVISLKLPSRELPKNVFPAPADSTWSVEWKEIREKEDKFEYIATKKFQNPDDFRREYAAPRDTGAIGLRVSVEKKFEWFFTYIEYTEAYTYRNPFGYVPISDYLTRQEIERFQRGEENDTLKQQVKRWNDREEFEEVYRSLVAEAVRRNDPDLPASLLMEKKEECFAQIEALDSTKSGVDENAADSSQQKIDIPQYAIAHFARVLGTPAILKYLPVARQAVAVMEQKESKIIHPDGWNYSVQMPGLILETNSNEVEGNAASWKFGLDQVKVGEYVMHASSRVTNIWTFVVTGFPALLVILGALRLSFRRK
jgi:hypothetical protein